ncbi:MAG: rhomboid family intramembrane serine protease [Chitinophagaceae bacterium]|nr:rhomboid family intramembrane serine protease [Chitinophagaceae bacterium]
MHANSKSEIVRRFFKSDLIKIIGFSTLFFVLVHFIRITYLISGKEVAGFTDTYWRHLTLGGTWSATLKKAWVLVSYAFLDTSFLRLLTNMIWLWIFGSVLEDLKGPFRVLPVFLTGAFLGAVGLITFSDAVHIPYSEGLTGAQAGIWAVLSASLSYRPQYKFWMLFDRGIPLYVFAGIFILLQLLQINFYHPGMYVYFGAALIAGLFYNSVLSSYYDGFTRILKSLSAYLGNNRNFLTKSVQKKTNSFEMIRSGEERINRILDKINLQGMHSLSADERKTLDEYSKQL